MAEILEKYEHNETSLLPALDVPSPDVFCPKIDMYAYQTQRFKIPIYSFHQEFTYLFCPTECANLNYKHMDKTYIIDNLSKRWRARMLRSFFNQGDF